MSERRLTAFVAAAAVLLASVATHVVAAALDLQTKAAAGHKRFGSAQGPANALISGSSLTYDGVAWTEVARTRNLAIESWPVPGSSPAEWEQLQRRSPEATTT